MSKDAPFLSVVIPAYNESDYLPETLHHLNQALDTVDVPSETIVVDNNSSDRTAEVAEQRGAEVVFEPKNQISRARNAGAGQAQGDWFLFLDADTHVTPGLIRSIVTLARNEPVVGGGAELEFIENTPGFAQLGLATWNWISSTFKLAAGSLLWCHRDAFKEVGGFNESVYASEEIWMSRNLKKYGSTHGLSFNVISSSKPQTSARKFEQFSLTQLTAGFLLFFLAPWIIFSKRACNWYWYENHS